MVKQKWQKSVRAVVVDCQSPVALCPVTSVELACNECSCVLREKKTMQDHAIFHKVVTVALTRVTLEYC